jgi:hypothetical protein
MDYIARDRREYWGPSRIVGTKFQFATARFFIFNETGHQVSLTVTSSGKQLFEQWLDAELVQDPEAGRQPHTYADRYPYASVYVPDFDTLTRSLDLNESLYLHRSETVDLDAIPRSERQGDLSIRITDRGFEVKYAIYSYR